MSEINKTNNPEQNNSALSSQAAKNGSELKDTKDTKEEMNNPEKMVRGNNGKSVANEQPIEKSRRLLINKRYQSKLVMQMVMPVLFFATLVLLSIYILLKKFQQLNKIYSMENVCQYIKTYFPNLFNPANQAVDSFVFYFMLLSSLAAFFYVVYLIIAYLYYSHRIVGPILRFESAFVRVLKGDLTERIFLRKKDQFQQLADNYNVMAETLQERVKRIYKFNQHLQQTIIEMKENPADDKESSLDKLYELSQGIEEEMEKFSF